ncbi:hypothetical protein EDD16DRAFT_1628622 [Pisolithus croceorrhizus]|nr:hypothetical protein EDD16DRAFT_1628622 [Pisolithus croceorrhizus]KAI6116711.1 hypothetical protein EV401DRAFT_1973472 [Pisolithus croceorrhizus]KAI6160391.1 hypothetical protein EDD17DRAFT_817324 [Pisolithus thermaeus]
MQRQGEAALRPWQKFINCVELVHEMLSRCEVVDLQQLLGATREQGAGTSIPQTANLCRHTVTSLLARFCRRSSAPVIGCHNSSLYLLLPKRGTTWSPSDLDIYVPARHSTQILNQLLDEGCRIISEPQATKLGYRFSFTAPPLTCAFLRSLYLLLPMHYSDERPVFSLRHCIVTKFSFALVYQDHSYPLNIGSLVLDGKL